MHDIQYICVDGTPRFAVVPIELWDRLSRLPEVTSTTDPAPRAAHAALLAGDHPLKAWRSARRLTHQELADRSGVSRPYIALIETDKRAGTLDTFERLARVLDVTPDALWRSGENLPLPRPGRRKTSDDQALHGTV